MAHKEIYSIIYEGEYFDNVTSYVQDVFLFCGKWEKVHTCHLFNGDHVVQRNKCSKHIELPEGGIGTIRRTIVFPTKKFKVEADLWYGDTYGPGVRHHSEIITKRSWQMYKRKKHTKCSLESICIGGGGSIWE